MERLKDTNLPCSQMPNAPFASVVNMSKDVERIAAAIMREKMVRENAEVRRIMSSWLRSFRSTREAELHAVGSALPGPGLTRHWQLSHTASYLKLEVGESQVGF